MYIELSSNFYFGEGLSEPKQRRGLPGVNEGTKSFDRRRERMTVIIEMYRKSNALLRKPCPCCGTLVRPALLDEHYDAYHPHALLKEAA